MNRLLLLLPVILLGCSSTYVYIHHEKATSSTTHAVRESPARETISLAPRACPSTPIYQLPSLPPTPTLRPPESLSEGEALRAMQVYMRAMIDHDRLVREILQESYREYLDSLDQ